MSTRVSRDKYDRLKQKAEKWQNLALDYKERIKELQHELERKSETDSDHTNNYKQVISDLTDQLEKWKSKAEKARTSTTDNSEIQSKYERLLEEYKEFKLLQKDKFKELEDKHKYEISEITFDSREKILDLKNTIRLKDGEIQTEKRNTEETIKHWKDIMMKSLQRTKNKL